MELAQRAAELACRHAAPPAELANVLDTLAAAYWVAGRAAEAAETQERAPELLPADSRCAPDFRTRLAADRRGLAARRFASLQSPNAGGILRP